MSCLVSTVRIFSTVIILSFSFILTGCTSTSNIAYQDSIKLNDCWFESHEAWPDSECGVLTVPENYLKPEGKKIQLPFIIFKSATSLYKTAPLNKGESKPEHLNTKTVPLVIAGGGGPGSPLGIEKNNSKPLDVSLLMSWYAATIESGRDLILIDNRGVGSSKPELACFEVIDAEIEALNKVVSVREAIEITKDSFALCKARLIEQGVDISQYHVTNAAKDLEMLRLGLGLEQLNVYGFSYGSRVALVYEKMYPNSVRTLILDGVYPQTGRSLEDIPKVNYEAVKQVFNKCHINERCRLQYGSDLEKTLADYLKYLKKEPVSISIKNPLNQEPVNVIVTPDVFFNSLYEMMYSQYAIASIPKVLHSAINGDTRRLSEMVRDFYVRPIAIDSINLGAYASYSCFDAYPFTDFTSARNEVKKYPLQHYSNQYTVEVLKTMCEVWSVPAAPDSFTDTYKINTPVLIYSGELDPITPAALVKPVLEGARISWSKVWSNISHGVIFNSDCADLTAAMFLNKPTSNPFVLDCLDASTKFYFEPVSHSKKSKKHNG